MPQPSSSLVHVSRSLTNISVAYIQNETDFVASRVFPVVPVEKQGDQYLSYPKGAWFRTEARRRGPGTESPGSGWNLTRDTYFADVYAVHKDIDDQIRANADTEIQLDRDSTRWVTGQLLLKRDLDWASTYFTTGVWGTDVTGVSGAPAGGQVRQWSDYTNSNPITDIANYQTTMAGATGMTPNTLVVGPAVYNALRNHTQIIERIKYTQRGVLTEDLLAALLGVDRLIVARAIYNSAPEGIADSMSYIFGKQALLCYSTPNPSLLTPTAGYIFSWTGLLGSGAFANRIKRFRIEERESDRVEGEMAYDMKVVAPDLGVFFNSVVA